MASFNARKLNFDEEFLKIISELKIEKEYLHEFFENNFQKISTNDININDLLYNLLGYIQTKKKYQQEEQQQKQQQNQKENQDQYNKTTTTTTIYNKKENIENETQKQEQEQPKQQEALDKTITQQKLELIRNLISDKQNLSFLTSSSSSVQSNSQLTSLVDVNTLLYHHQQLQILQQQQQQFNFLQQIQSHQQQQEQQQQIHNNSQQQLQIESINNKEKQQLLLTSKFNIYNKNIKNNLKFQTKENNNNNNNNELKTTTLNYSENQQQNNKRKYKNINQIEENYNFNIDSSDDENGNINNLKENQQNSNMKFKKFKLSKMKDDIINNSDKINSKKMYNINKELLIDSKNVDSNTVSSINEIYNINNKYKNNSSQQNENTNQLKIDCKIGTNYKNSKDRILNNNDSNNNNDNNEDNNNDDDDDSNNDNDNNEDNINDNDDSNNHNGGDNDNIKDNDNNNDSNNDNNSNSDNDEDNNDNINDNNNNDNDSDNDNDSNNDNNNNDNDNNSNNDNNNNDNDNNSNNDNNNNDNDSNNDNNDKDKDKDSDNDNNDNKNDNDDNNDNDSNNHNDNNDNMNDSINDNNNNGNDSDNDNNNEKVNENDEYYEDDYGSSSNNGDSSHFNSIIDSNFTTLFNSQINTNSLTSTKKILDKNLLKMFSPTLQLSQLQNDEKLLLSDQIKNLQRFGSHLECNMEQCKYENLREHFHCYDIPCFGKPLNKKEEIIRHIKWHKKRNESLNYGFLRFSSSDDCSSRFGPNCQHNHKQTHYHCFQPNCDKVYISTSDVQMHSNYHRKDSAIFQEGFQRFRATEKCNTSYCMFSGQRTTHFHCRRENCNFTFKNKADMEKHKTYHIKDLQLTRDGFKKFLKNEPCPYKQCRFSRVCNHIHCIRKDCFYILHSSGQLLSHKRKHERMDGELQYQNYKMLQLASEATSSLNNNSNNSNNNNNNITNIIVADQLLTVPTMETEENSPNITDNYNHNKSIKSNNDNIITTTVTNTTNTITSVLDNNCTSNINRYINSNYKTYVELKNNNFKTTQSKLNLSGLVEDVVGGGDSNTNTKIKTTTMKSNKLKQKDDININIKINKIDIDVDFDNSSDDYNHYNNDNDKNIKSNSPIDLSLLNENKQKKIESITGTKKPILISPTNIPNAIQAKNNNINTETFSISREKQQQKPLSPTSKLKTQISVEMIQQQNKLLQQHITENLNKTTATLTEEKYKKSLLNLMLNNLLQRKMNNNIRDDSDSSCYDSDKMNNNCGNITTNVIDTNNRNNITTILTNLNNINDIEFIIKQYFTANCSNQQSLNFDTLDKLNYNNNDYYNINNQKPLNLKNDNDNSNNYNLNNNNITTATTTASTTGGIYNHHNIKLHEPYIACNLNINNNKGDDDDDDDGNDDDDDDNEINNSKTLNENLIPFKKLHFHCLYKNCKKIIMGYNLEEIFKHIQEHEFGKISTTTTATAICTEKKTNYDNIESLIINKSKINNNNNNGSCSNVSSITLPPSLQLIQNQSNLTQITSIEGFFNRKRGRPPKNRVVEVYNSNKQQTPQAIFTSFKLEKGIEQQQQQQNHQHQEIQYQQNKNEYNNDYDNNLKVSFSKLSPKLSSSSLTSSLSNQDLKFDINNSQITQQFCDTDYADNTTEYTDHQNHDIDDDNGDDENEILKKDNRNIKHKNYDNNTVTSSALESLYQIQQPLVTNAKTISMSTLASSSSEILLQYTNFLKHQQQRQQYFQLYHANEMCNNKNHNDINDKNYNDIDNDDINIKTIDNDDNVNVDDNSNSDINVNVQNDDGELTNKCIYNQKQIHFHCKFNKECQYKTNNSYDINRHLIFQHFGNNNTNNNSMDSDNKSHSNTNNINNNNNNIVQTSLHPTDIKMEREQLQLFGEKFFITRKSNQIGNMVSKLTDCDNEKVSVVRATGTYFPQNTISINNTDDLNKSDNTVQLLNNNDNISNFSSQINSSYNTTSSILYCQKSFCRLKKRPHEHCEMCNQAFSDITKLKNHRTKHSLCHNSNIIDKFPLNLNEQPEDLSVVTQKSSELSNENSYLEKSNSSFSENLQNISSSCISASRFNPINNNQQIPLASPTSTSSSFSNTAINFQKNLIENFGNNIQNLHLAQLITLQQQNPFYYQNLIELLFQNTPSSNSIIGKESNNIDGNIDGIVVTGIDSIQNENNDNKISPTSNLIPIDLLKTHLNNPITAVTAEATVVAAPVSPSISESSSKNENLLYSHPINNENNLLNLEFNSSESNTKKRKISYNKSSTSTTATTTVNCNKFNSLNLRSTLPLSIPQTQTTFTSNLFNPLNLLPTLTESKSFKINPKQTLCSSNILPPCTNQTLINQSIPLSHNITSIDNIFKTNSTTTAIHTTGTTKHGGGMFKDEPVPNGYLKFRFNEDCNFQNCGYRNHQSHFHCVRNDCFYSFCDKTRFVQHTARHERLDKLMGDDFKQYRASMRCNYEECAYNKNFAEQNNKSSHFHCLKCNFICSDTNKVVAHRRQHSKAEFFRMAGFRKISNNEKCDTNFNINLTKYKYNRNNKSVVIDECPYNMKQTHYHCLSCDIAVLSRAQLTSHKHRTTTTITTTATTAETSILLQDTNSNSEMSEIKTTTTVADDDADDICDNENNMIITNSNINNSCSTINVPSTNNKNFTLNYKKTKNNTNTKMTTTDDHFCSKDNSKIEKIKSDDVTTIETESDE